MQLSPSFLSFLFLSMLLNNFVFADEVKPLEMSEKCAKVYSEYSDQTSGAGGAILAARLFFEPYNLLINRDSSDLAGEIKKEVKKKKQNTSAMLKKMGCPSITDIQSWYENTCPKVWPTFIGYTKELSALNIEIESLRDQIKKNKDMNEDLLTAVIKEKETALNKHLKTEQELENKIKKIKQDFQFNYSQNMLNEIIKEAKAIADLINECNNIVGKRKELDYLNDKVRWKQHPFYGEIKCVYSPTLSGILIRSNEAKYLLEQIIKNNKEGYNCLKTEAKTDVEITCRENSSNDIVFNLKLTKDRLEKLGTDDYFYSPEKVVKEGFKYDTFCPKTKAEDSSVKNKTPSKEEIAMLINSRAKLKTHYDSFEKLFNSYLYFIRNSLFGRCVYREMVGYSKPEYIENYTIEPFLDDNTTKGRNRNYSYFEKEINEERGNYFSKDCVNAKIGFYYAFSEGYEFDYQEEISKINKDLSYCEIRYDQPPQKNAVTSNPVELKLE